MGNDESKKENKLLNSDDQKIVCAHDDLKLVRGITRREFIEYTGSAIICGSFSSLVSGCGGGSGARVPGYPIDSTVVKTTERMIAFPYIGASAAPHPGHMPQPGDPAFPASSPNGGTALTWDQLCRIPDYDRLGYGKWIYVDWPLPLVQRTDIMPAGYTAASVTQKAKLINFFAMTDIHITDKEAPNQLIRLQQSLPGLSLIHI
jgi:hypothetical protein